MNINKRTLHGLLTAVTFWLIAGCSTLGTGTDGKSADQGDTSPGGPAVTLDEHYSSAEFDLDFRWPSDWVLTEEPLPGSDHKAINIFRKGTGAAEEIPLHVHAASAHSYIAVLPGGWGTEFPNSQLISFSQAKDAPELSFEVDSAKSKVLQLKSGAPWAYFVVPADPPPGWSESGFIFAQIQTGETIIYCRDAETGEKQSLKNCDYARGDQFIREGKRNERDAVTIHKILASLSLAEI